MNDNGVVVEKLQSVISNRLGVPTEDITLGSSFKDDLGADSLDVVELIMEIEDAFNLEVSDEAAAGMLTVRHVVDYIISKSQ